MAFEELRRAFTRAGLMPATARPASSHGRAEEAAIRPATLIEGHEVRAVPVGPPEPCPDPIAFLDGVQRHQVVAYAGTFPVVVAVVAAAVRERRGRELRTAIEDRRVLVIGRADALDAAPVGLAGHQQVILEDDEDTEHPVRYLERAVAAIDDARSELEVRVGRAWRERSDAWLLVDGSLAESPAFAADRRMLGVSKSHATLPFRGGGLATYLRLPEGHRSSVFEPASRRVAPVYAWGLRLWPFEGRDLLFGLVRVEAAKHAGTLDQADRWSRWVLAERSPISAPDARWDRLLYGIHNVEAYLRSALPVR